MKWKSIAAVALLMWAPALARPEHPKWPPKSYAIYYGRWDAATLAKAHEFDCVIFHPGDFTNISASQLKALQAGKDGKAGTPDDVIAIGYVSVGEDEKAPASYHRGDVSGPTLQSGDGKWTPSGKGYPARYLDEQTYVFDAQGRRQRGENGKPLVRKGHDGIPDENGVWGSYYAFTGDPGWRQEVLERMGRLQEMGVDGFFLDTVDTASPWGAYGGTQAYMAELLVAIRQRFPQRAIVANRGMFLLDKFPQQYGGSIDGMLYESLYTVWDWTRGEGIQSPWSRGDYDNFKNQVLPAAQKFGFQLFFVNYLNPQQRDFFPLAATAHELVSAPPASSGLEYLADPLLAKFYPPYAQYIPQDSPEKAPHVEGLAVQELGQGRFLLRCEIEGLGSRVLGRDYFLDLRYGDWLPGPYEGGLLPPIPFDYSALKIEQKGSKTLVSLQSYGLEKSTTYHFFARGVGRARSLDTPFSKLTLATVERSGPVGVQELQAVSLEKSVRLHWKSDATEFRVYQGENPGALKLVANVNKPEARIGGLSNGKSYYFAVAPGGDGPLSRPILGHAEDCTPPPAPQGIEADLQAGGGVTIRWRSSGQEVKIYKIYCVPQGQPYGIPVKAGKEATSHLLKEVPPGHYWVAVTALDGHGNESEIGQKITLTVP